MQARSHDIHTRLVREGVTAQQARLITDLAADQGIKPVTMWMWLDEFDAESLGIVVAADLSHLDMVAHLGYGTCPNLEELKIFAAAKGLIIAGWPLRDVRRTVLVDSGVTAHSSTPLPPMHQPGSWPGLLVPDHLP